MIDAPLQIGGAMFGLLEPVPLNFSLGCGNTWSSVLCSVCAQLGEDFGVLARFAAGPDTALLAALYEAQNDASARRRQHYCPLRGGPALLWRGTEHVGTRFAAMVSLLAAAARLEDHLFDNELPVSWFAARRLARRWAHQARRSAATFGFDISLLERQIITQRQRERQLGQCPLYYAEPTAFCFGEAFAHTAVLSRRPENVEPLRQAGAAFGRQLYLLDAAIDFVEDARNARFNALHTVADSSSARDAAGTLVAGVQQSLEHHLSLASLCQPDWIKPVLVGALRSIGRQRVGNVCTSGRPSSEETPPTTAAPEPPNRRRFLSSLCKWSGGFGGLVCGGCCGQACVDCQRQNPCAGCNTDCKGCDCRCR